MSEFMMEFNDDSNMEMGFSEAIHNELSGRGEPDAHPISAITGLGDRLDEIDSDIETISGEIGGLETSKQDKLTAGSLVDITNNTISIDMTSITNSEIDVMFE
jgi:hypothetical protein